MIKTINNDFNVNDFDFVITPSYLENYYKERFLDDDVLISNIKNFVLNNYTGDKTLASDFDSQVIMYNTLNKVKDDLTYYKNIRIKDMVNELINTYDDFYDYDLIDSNKIIDLRLIYKKFEEELLNKGLINYRMLFNDVLENNSFSGSCLFTCFSHFDKKELSLLEKISREASLYVLLDNVCNDALYKELKKIDSTLEFNYDDVLKGKYYVKALNDISDEVSFVSNDIACKMYNKEAKSYDDFLIVTNSVNNYLPYFDLFFNHPYTNEKTSGLLVSRFLNTFLKVLNGDFSCGTFIDLLKTDVLNVDEKMTSLIYNYVYHYDIYTELFYLPFNKNYYSKDVLDKINEVKDSIINPIRHLALNVVESNNKTEILRYLYIYLSEEGILDNLYLKDEAGCELLISLLESINNNLDINADLKVIIDVLENACLTRNKVVSMQDCVTVTDLKNACFEDKKFVYLIGADTILSDFKINGLINVNDVSKSLLIDKINYHENYAHYLFYKVLSKNGIISYPKLGSDLRLKEASPLLDLISKKDYDVNKIYDKNMLINDYATRLSKNEIDGVLDDDFKFINESNNHDLNYTVDKKIIKKIYGDTLSITPSKMETYAKCPFMFFVNYTLNVNDGEKDLFDNRKIGSLVHFVLEEIIKNDITKVNDDVIDNLIYKYAILYLKENDVTITNVIDYVVKQVSKSIKEVIKNIIKERNVSNFKPLYLEFRINDDALIKPVLIKLDNANLKLSGIVDRVDVCEDDDNFYFRVIDYKTGDKKFRLDDVLDGLNLQMLLYMLTINKEGNKLTNKRVYPSAILYYPALVKNQNASRSLSSAEKEEKIRESLKMNGMVLNDDKVLSNLGSNNAGNFISFTTRGKINEEKVYTLDELDAIFKCIKKVLKTYGNDILNGRFKAAPFKGRNDACLYCKYSAICKFDGEMDKKRKAHDMKNKEAIKLMEGEDYADMD